MGHSALYGASSCGKREVVRLLLQNGANVNLSTEVTIIMHALIVNIFN